jgi:hypothetical protein
MFHHAQMRRCVLWTLLTLSFSPTICARWNTPETLLPPLIPFVSLLNQTAFNRSHGGYAYDNTTCAGRCCRRVEVARAPDAACVADWRACARLSRDSTAPRCGAGASFPCAAWVPCDRQGWQEGVMPLVALTVVACFLPCLKCLVNVDTSTGMVVRTHLGNPAEWKALFDGASVAAMIILGMFYASSIVVGTDYEQFEAYAETNLEFVSYQHCVEGCNRYIPWDTDEFGGKLDTYQKFYCRDSTYNLSGFALFPANYNQRPGSSACPTSWQPGIGGSYESWHCSSCYERRGEWVYLHGLSLFHRVRGYACWIVLLLAVYMGLIVDAVFVYVQLRVEQARWREWHSLCMNLVTVMVLLPVLGGVGHFGCLVADAAYMYYLNSNWGLNWTLKAVSRYDVYGFCAASHVMDILGIFLFMGMFGGGSKLLGTLQEHESMGAPPPPEQPEGVAQEGGSKSSQGSLSARLGGMRIEPSDVVRVAKDRMV